MGGGSEPYPFARIRFNFTHRHGLLLSGKLYITRMRYGAEEKVCQAQFGGGGGPAPPAPAASSASDSVPASASATPAMTGAPAPAPPPAGSEGVQGGSKTHTIIVAPTQGVLRFGKSTFKAR
jgi:hypothetical protein